MSPGCERTKSGRSKSSRAWRSARAETFGGDGHAVARVFVRHAPEVWHDQRPPRVEQQRRDHCVSVVSVGSALGLRAALRLGVGLSGLVRERGRLFQGVGSRPVRRPDHDADDVQMIEDDLEVLVAAPRRRVDLDQRPQLRPAISQHARQKRPHGVREAQLVAALHLARDEIDVEARVATPAHSRATTPPTGTAPPAASTVKPYSDSLSATQRASTETAPILSSIVTSDPYR